VPVHVLGCTGCGTVCVAALVLSELQHAAGKGAGRDQANNVTAPGSAAARIRPYMHATTHTLCERYHVPPYTPFFQHMFDILLRLCPCPRLHRWVLLPPQHTHLFLDRYGQLPYDWRAQPPGGDAAAADSWAQGRRHLIHLVQVMGARGAAGGGG
jgi:hypothetical protein